MTPEEQLLCFIAAEDTAVDPIRIMKGLFVFTQAAKEGKPLPQQGLFHFDAMGYGPCSIDIYNALDSLSQGGAIEWESVPGATWGRYRITARGKDRVAQVVRAAPEESVSFLARIRQWCDAQTFTSLLRKIYHAWPEYAKNSVLPHLRPNE